MSAILRELSEDVLRSDDALDDALAAIIEEGKTGIALRAPANVSTAALADGKGSGLPLAVCCVQTLREAMKRPPFRRMAILAATQLETGVVRAAPVADDPGERLAPPQRDPGDGFTGTAFRVNVAERLGIPPIPGPLAVWLIARGQVAGPVRIQVGSPSKPGYEDPEAEKFLARWRKYNNVTPSGADPASVWPEETIFGSYPTYRPGAESPPMPKKGIALLARSAVALERNSPWVVAGAYRLAIPGRHVVMNPVSGNPTTAVVPITLIVTSNELAGPVVKHLRAPSYSPVKQSGDASIVEGYFTLNLHSFRRMWNSPQTYFVYALCGDSISNPAMTALGTKRGE